MWRAPADLRHRMLRGAEVELHVAEAGDGPLLVLLHGFPEFWYGWRRQIPRLAADGFRVVAPDLRGYNRSGRPPEVEAYRMERLVEDVLGLVEALGESDAVLVGHDWGGIIAWYTAMYRPARVRRLVILNSPHPAAYAREMRRLSSQTVRSWYAVAFQLPAVPEAVLRARNFALLRRALRTGPADDAEELRAYLAAFAAPGALSAALNYYRALGRHGAPDARTITVPTLLVWGDRDPFLVPALTEGLESWVPDLRVERLADAGHWLHHQQPERIAHLIGDFARGA